MYRTLALSLGPIDVGGPQVFNAHPMQLARFLEEVWLVRPGPVPETPGLLEVPAALAGQERTSGLVMPALPIQWDHLIYAYMVENTRIFEIFRRVLEEFAYGERLGNPPDEVHRWLRTSEQLFYSDDAPYQIFSFTSQIRPDARALRRNAYFRMFGLDLNHGTDDNRPYPYPRPAAANGEFPATFEEWLREVWRGIENFTNTSGPTPVDPATTATLARRLFDMLGVRRIDGNLAREELAFVSAMSWFHLTVGFDSPIVDHLDAQATSPEERLLKIGARVGLPAHSRSGAYFRLATNMSYILWQVESGAFNVAGGVGPLYDQANPIGAAMIEIIRDWSLVTGRDVKSRRVDVSPPAPRRLRPTPVPAAPPTAAARVTRMGAVPGAPTNGSGQLGRETSPVQS